MNKVYSIAYCFAPSYRKVYRALILAGDKRSAIIQLKNKYKKSSIQVLEMREIK